MRRHTYFAMADIFGVRRVEKSFVSFFSPHRLKGHGGANAARFCAAHFLDSLKRALAAVPLLYLPRAHANIACATGLADVVAVAKQCDGQRRSCEVDWVAVMRAATAHVDASLRAAQEQGVQRSSCEGLKAPCGDSSGAVGAVLAIHRVPPQRGNHGRNGSARWQASL